jgi:hypothetical protein
MGTTVKSKVEAIKASNNKILDWIDHTVRGSYGSRVVFGTVTHCEVEFKYKLKSQSGGGLVQTMIEVEYELNRFGDIVAGRRDQGEAIITIRCVRHKVGL